MPPGILNVVTGLGSRIGNPLVQHPGVRMVSFTGGTATGRVIAHAAADKLMPVALELGGKSPHIVFADADLDAAIDGVIGGIFEGSGQSCVAGSRLCSAASPNPSSPGWPSARAGCAWICRTRSAQMGPIASFDHRGKIEGMVDAARREGAEVVLGGQRPDQAQLRDGAFYRRPSCPAWRATRPWCEEIFGPVLCALAFEDEDDLIDQANDSVTAWPPASGPPTTAAPGGGPAAGSRQRMDQHLQAAVDRHAVRRL